MQRLFDLIFSTFALSVLSPLLVPLAILLRLTGEGEIFFLQERVGKEGKSFKLYKFATMLKDSPNMSTGTVTVRNDPRILPLGGWMRTTKINELPQLLNILKGDMSIIGPRPQTRRCFEAFTPAAQLAIAQVRPGLSGVGSIIFRGEEDIVDGQEDPATFYDNVIAPYKGSLEEWYIDNQGLRTYFTLIFLTAWVVLVPRSQAAWDVLRGLPKPNQALAGALLSEKESLPWADTLLVQRDIEVAGVYPDEGKALQDFVCVDDRKEANPAVLLAAQQKQRVMESS